MAGTFTFLVMHFVFSTKNRIPLIDNTMNERLYAYIGGIIRELSGKLIEINSMPKHIHFYEYMPKTVSKSAEDTVIQYIRNQQEHHRNKSFQEEFIDFLKKYGIEYDENYIWK